MTDYNAVASALEAVAESVGLNAMDYVPDDLPNVGFYVGEMDIEPNQTFGSSTRPGTEQATITCRLLVARSSDRHAIRKMRDYLASSGTKSLVQAIQSDKTLGGTVDACKVVSLRGNRLFTVGEGRFYGTEIDVFVIGESA